MKPRDIYINWSDKVKKNILIVGGVAGGASAAARLRRLDETTQIIMFERGEYISFANCGLPYHVAGRFDVQSIPTLILFKDGNEIRRFMGVQPKDILLNAINSAIPS